MTALTAAGGGVMASEWTKLRSVRSTYLTLLAAAVVAIAIGLLSTHSDVTDAAKWSPGQRAGFEPVNDSLVGFAIVQLAFGALGALVISSEHATGMIRTTFAAVPRRRTVLAAKAVVAGALTLVIGELLAFVTFYLGQLVLSGKHLDVTLGNPHVLRAVAGAGLFLSVIAVVGLSLGSIIRHSAGAIAAVFGLVFILPTLINALPRPWNIDARKWTLDGAVKGMISIHANPDQPSAGMALLALIAWVVVTLGTAMFLITRRDA